MIIIDAVDYLLLPFYIFIFYRIIIKIKKKYYQDSPLRKYLVYGFWAKIFASISFALLTQYYYNGGDSFMYYIGGSDFKETILKDFPQNLHFLFSPAQEFEQYYEMTFDKPYIYGYLGAPSNLMGAKFVAFFSFFSFNKYLIISLWFGLLSFSGFWQCFKILAEKYPLLRKPIAISFLFFPSVLFWGSGIMKDTLCIGFLGWLFFSAYKFFIKKEYTLKLLLTFVGSLYFIGVLKVYILIAFLPFLLLWILLERVKTIVNPALRVVILPVIFIIAAGSFYINKEVLSGILGEYAFENFTQTVKTSRELYERTTTSEGALINAGEIDPTLPGIIKAVPSSLFTALFRPFIWESKKLVTVFSALENMLILLFSLYVLFKTRVFGFFLRVFQNNLLFFFFFFSIVFATAIGLTCYNFGTLVRYKIPCMPFYLSSLIIILHLFKLNKLNRANVIEIKIES